jgi:predicted Zn-dependent protease
MSGSVATADTAFRVAEHLKRASAPWDVFGERITTHEIHFGPRGIELLRGPIVLEGYGLRLLRSRDGKIGVGYQASTDASVDGVASTLEAAESVSRYSAFPAKDVALPTGTGTGAPRPEITDPAVWADAPRALANYTSALFAAFQNRPGIGLSFGSVKTRKTEVTMANSSGLSAGYGHTRVELEVAVKSSGGAEGAPPGEYWVTAFDRRLDATPLPRLADDWSRYASDARRAKAPPGGEHAVVLPPSVLEAILPASLGYKLSGRAELREMSPAIGSTVGASQVTLEDDGTLPWAFGSSPLDDEGTPQRRRTLIRNGVTTELLYDALHGSALNHASTGSAFRGGFASLSSGGSSFGSAPGPSCTTLTIPGGDGGSDEELIEAAGEGIWVQQLGWASPDGLTTMFGGEIRIGYRIRHGKLAEPVRGGTLGGLVLAGPNTPSLLANVAGIGSRATLTGHVSVPTLLVRPMTLGGDEVATSAA